MKNVKLFGLLALFALLAVALGFPLLFPNPAVMSIAFFTLIFAGAATAWNIFSGYTGYISLGHVSFYGLGVYTMALGSRNWHIPGGYLPFLLVPLAGLIAGVVAIPLGWIALRTRRQTFIVITIAMFFILQLLAYNLSDFTGGSGGLFLPFPPWSGDFYNFPFYYVALTLLLLALVASWWVRQSKYGLGLLAIRDDEDRALSLGLKTEVYKLSAFVLAAIFIGMAGALFAYYIGIISPPLAFDPSFDVTVALMAFLGGIGTLAGPILGALVVEPLQQYITIQASASGIEGLDLIIYGILFLAILFLLPEGILPTLRKLWLRWTATRSTKATLSPITVSDSEGEIQEKPSLAQEGEGVNL